jgi:protein TonB
MVIALVLLVVFTRPSASKAVATPVKEATPAPAPEINQANLIVNQPVKTSAKPIAGTPVVKPTDTPADATGSTASAPVSPDAMAQQLVAPTRIAGSIKKTAAADEPLAAPAPVSMDDNSEVPGSVFGSANKAKVTAHVVAISAGVADGMILRKTAPVYPKFAQEAHITGTVTLKATITKQGTIEGVQVLSGPKILAPAAVEAVKTWKYKPYMLDNQPVSVETDIKIVFGSSK